jgi:hypothetical protein
MRRNRQMKRRSIIISSAAALGLAAAGLSVAVAVSQATASRVQTVSAPISLDPAVPGDVFAPPPANASPALTAQQAVTKAYGVPSDTAIPSKVSVQLGLYTLPVGPAADCDGCSGDTVVNGIAYSQYQTLAYGLERSGCSDGSLTTACAIWDFIDANTGENLGGVGPTLAPSSAPSPSA